MGQSLGWYLNDTANLMRDQSYLFTSQRQMTRWINEARREAAKRSGCLRYLIPGQSPFGTGAQPGSLIPGAAQPGMLPGSDPNAINSTTTNSFNTIVGCEMYPFDFANPYLQAQYEGVKSVIDVIALSISWGGERPSLIYMPWEDLQAYARSYNVGVFSYPFYWSTNGDGENAQVWIFPGPTQALEMEWDVFAMPSDLVDDNSYDAIPGGFESCIKFYACHLMHMASERWGSAKLMEDKFNQSLGVSRVASDRGKAGNYYYMSE